MAIVLDPGTKNLPDWLLTAAEQLKVCTRVNVFDQIWPAKNCIYTSPKPTSWNIVHQLQIYNIPIYNADYKEQVIK